MYVLVVLSPRRDEKIIKKHRIDLIFPKSNLKKPHQLISGLRLLEIKTVILRLWVGLRNLDKV